MRSRSIVVTSANSISQVKVQEKVILKSLVLKVLGISTERSQGKRVKLKKYLSGSLYNKLGYFLVNHNVRELKIVFFH